MRALAVAAGLALLAGAALAQGQPGAAFPKGAYAPLDRLPDWGGVWIVEPTPGAAANPPRLKGQYLKAYEDWRAKTQAGQAVANGSLCLPPGMPRMMTLPQYPIEYLFTPGRVTLHFEAWMQWRNIWTDGRGHPADLDPTFSGHSIGHWEGDTLVVDTVGIKETTPIIAGMTHSDQLHVAERIHLDPSTPDRLLVETTVTDPLALEASWSSVIRMKRTRGGELFEYVCAENDRNPVDSTGHVQFK